MTATLPDQDSVVRPERPTRPRTVALSLVVFIAVAWIWGVSGLDASWSRLRSAPGDAWGILRLMWPPNFDTVVEFTSDFPWVANGSRDVIPKVLESVYIAWVGTLIGATISLPLAFLASHNISPTFIRRPVRMLFNMIRSVPELIVAFVLLGVVPLGAWAGALAIGLHSVGTLGKLSSEEIESADGGPVEAVEACGGTFISRVRWGVLPQVMPSIASYWLFRFEINVRASAVLGMIGAGGVGSELVAQLNFRNFPEVGAVLFVTVIVVVSIDTVSSAVRRRIIAGDSGDDPSRFSAALQDLTGIGRKTA